MRRRYLTTAQAVDIIDVVLDAALTVNLSMTKSDSPDPVSSGQNVTYAISVTNNGRDTAPGVTFTDAGRAERRSSRRGLAATSLTAS